MRLVGSSLPDINFQCFKQWFLKLIHFHWFFQVLAICRKASHHSHDFKFFCLSMFLISTPWISSFAPLRTHTLWWKRINCGLMKLWLIFRWWLERFVQNYQFALVSLSAKGWHLAANSISEFSLYAWLISYPGTRRVTVSLQFVSVLTGVTTRHQQMAVLAWATTNVTHKPGCTSPILMASWNSSMPLIGYG